MNPSNGTIQKPKCDLIMKGGITSGVVFPALIFELQKTYRFSSIGGTSAGAIAAALTAAAELGRNKEGFDKFEKIKDELCKEGFLLNLFQPNKEAKPLMDLGLDMLNRKKGGGRWFKKMLMFRFFPWFLAGAIFDYIFWWHVYSGIVLLLLSFSIVLILMGIGLLIWLLPIYCSIKRLHGQGFGICSGRTDPDVNEYAGTEVLTDWLAEKLKLCAGIEGRPLTFQDLWGKDSNERHVDLQMFTSNLSQGQPYVFPLDQDELFIFKKEEFLEYFGDEVINHMIGTSPENGNWKLPEGYHLFPPPAEFPVIVATRMSLSFPVLFRAVPVYTLPVNVSRGDQLKESDLQLNWFSDGGICSNFPIHFFDAWFPTWPTFGVNLTSFGPESMTQDGLNVLPRANVRKNNEDFHQFTKLQPNVADVFLPKAEDLQSPQFKEIKDLFAFFGSILETAKDCHDNLQSTLPSYRERIVQIRLKKDEGGLNLVMPEQTIRNMIDKGQRAGVHLAGFDLKLHQWVRLRVLLTQLAQSFKEMESDLSEKKGFDVNSLFENQHNFPFPLDEEEAKNLLSCVRGLRKLITTWPGNVQIPRKGLKPEPVLRVVPPKL